MILDYDLTRTASAAFSPCRRYRYTLRRCFRGTVDEPPLDALIVCAKNPSKAGAMVTDPTTTVLCGLARRLGKSDLVLVNMQAYIATDPNDLLTVADPVGPENAVVLATLPPGTVLVAWGNHPTTRAHIAETVRLISRPMFALKINKDGSPHHPLRLSKSLVPAPWAPPETA